MKRNLALAFAMAGLTAASHAEIIYGINGLNQLVSFDSAAPTSLLTNVTISGATILNIDIRPATGVLYGLSFDNSLYTLSITTGVATLVGATGINGGFDFGFDFNPQADRLRVVLDDGADDNFRLLPDTGAIAFTDGDLNYAAGDANSGDNPNIVGAAYTNNVAAAPSTQLYYIDSENDTLATTTLPNSGVLNTVGTGLGAGDITGLAGFDISGTTGTAYAAFSTDAGTTSQLYTVNLTSGAATLVGGIGSAAGTTILDIAAPVPEPSTAGILALGALGLSAFRRFRRVAC